MISLIDLKHRYKEEQQKLLKIIDSTLKKGNLVLTEEVNKFEEDIKKFTKSKYCVSLNSGTDALMMSLMACGIKKNDEVITTPITFIATIGAIIHVGAKPVFVDVDHDLNINPRLIEKVITEKTKAIIPVHWGGNICKMDEIMKISKKYKIKVIEDAAQSIGSFYNNKHAGTYGEISSFSTHPLKNLSSLGDGGFVITNNKSHYQKIKLYRNHGLYSRDSALIYGVNSRLDSLNAKVLSYRLKQLIPNISKRRKNVELYKKYLTSNKIKIAQINNNRENTYVMFLTICEKRDKLQKFLKKQGIQSLVYYGRPMHLHPIAKKMKLNKSKLSLAESVCKKVLALPIHQYLKETQIKYICTQINNFYKS
jgi:dTDP-4-amino-4,6-dideoxygalactose transaminase